MQAHREDSVIRPRKCKRLNEFKLHLQSEVYTTPS